MKAILLVGGLGTRLRPSVPSLPKALASVGERPFLELLVRQLAAQGFRELVLCTGYLAGKIESAFQDGSGFGVSIQYSREEEPLGTGGAIKLAERYLRDEREFLVLNGDSFVEIHFEELIAFHRGHSGIATIAAVPVEKTGRYGVLQMDGAGRVMGFAEKTGVDVPGTINAGIYVLNAAVLDRIPPGMVSLERDIFPKLLQQGVYARRRHGLFIDIGTPEDYVRAKNMCDRLAEISSSGQ